MAPVYVNQMSGEEVKMSGKAQKNFVYTENTTIPNPRYLYVCL